MEFDDKPREINVLGYFDCEEEIGKIVIRKFIVTLYRLGLSDTHHYVKFKYNAIVAPGVYSATR